MKRKILTIFLAVIFVISSLILVACKDSDSESAQPQEEPRIEGEYKTFGSYPQTDVTSSMGASLSSLQGELPTDLDAKDWTSYDYYISGSKDAAFMWFKDVNYDNEKYRAVYFTSYRPSYTSSSSSTSNSYQDDNGYELGKVYWFKFEPIEWRVLPSDDGFTLLLCEMIIDSQDYNYTINNQQISGKTVYANNYEYSSIRSWLNENFYNTAFNQSEQAKIQTTTVNNKAASTYNPINPYACANTKDKVYMLSFQEAKDSKNSFNSSAFSTDIARRKKNTDYAKAQGVYNDTSDKYAGKGVWWLRSPDRNSYSSAHYIRSDGTSEYSDNNINITFRGVVPVLKIQL